MDFKDAPTGLCEKTFDLVKDMEPHEVLAFMDRYCRKDAQFLCDKKFGFRPHKATLEWIVADQAVLDFLE